MSVIVLIKGAKYKLDEYYDRLRRVGLDDKVSGTTEYQAEADRCPAIACPKCLGTTFQISYGDYECIANCPCGNSFIIYDG